MDKLLKCDWSSVVILFFFWFKFDSFLTQICVMIYSPKCQQEIRTVTASHRIGYDCVPEQKEVSKLWMTPEMGTLEPPSARRPLPLTFPRVLPAWSPALQRPCLSGPRTTVSGRISIFQVTAATGPQSVLISRVAKPFDTVVFN